MSRMRMLSSMGVMFFVSVCCWCVRSPARAQQSEPTESRILDNQPFQIGDHVRFKAKGVTKYSEVEIPEGTVFTVFFVFPMLEPTQEKNVYRATGWYLDLQGDRPETLALHLHVPVEDMEKCTSSVDKEGARLKKMQASFDRNTEMLASKDYSVVPIKVGDTAILTAPKSEIEELGFAPGTWRIGSKAFPIGSRVQVLETPKPFKVTSSKGEERQIGWMPVLVKVTRGPNSGYRGKVHPDYLKKTAP